MKQVLRFFAVSLLVAGCDQSDTFTEILPPIPCILPPGHCEMDDEAFDAMWGDMSYEDQDFYLEEWGTIEDQRTGFVSREVEESSDETES